ncbi:myb-like protein O isoform X1 [Condylostylus longicornis]|uniref:myb-like protein O isoform X1 n=1 Tax=Condylostylus longicornis TaxID=2530218 RepID=UPI00244E1DA9|nr:myb-like protein O isoform X1 [Condylostylus longicornis]
MVRIKKNNFIYNKSIYCCIAPGCQNIDDDTHSNILFYIISENGLNQKPLTEFLENIPIRPKVSRICSEHFTEDCFQLHQGIKMLRPNAVPTIKTKKKLKSCITGPDRTINKSKDTQVKSGFEQSVIVKDLILENKTSEILSQKVQDDEKPQQKLQPQKQKQPIQEEEFPIVCGHLTFESCKNNLSFLCNFCQANLEYIGAFSTHLMRLHYDEMKNKTSQLTKEISKILDERQKCGSIRTSLMWQNSLQNCEFRFDCNFCNEKFKNIDDYSSHIGKSHLDLLKKDKETESEFEDDIDIDPSCILSFDQINDIDEMNSKNSTSTATIPSNSDENNNGGNKIIMSVPISDNSEIFMTIDINENENLTNTSNINNNNHNHNNNNNNNDNNNNNNDSNNNSNIYNKENSQRDVTMADNLDKPKLKVNIKHSSWATRYY